MDGFRRPDGRPAHEQSDQWRGGSLDAMLLDEWDDWKQQLSRGTKNVLAAPTGTTLDKNANGRSEVAGDTQPKVDSLADDLGRPGDCPPESICTYPVSRSSFSGGDVRGFRTPLSDRNGSSPRESQSREAAEAGHSADKMQIGRGTDTGIAGMAVASSFPNTSSPLRLRQLLAESILKARVAELSASHFKLQQKSYFNSWKESQTTAFALRSQAQNIESHFHLLKSFVEDLLDDVNDVNSIDTLQRLKERYFTREGQEREDRQQSPALTLFETAPPLTDSSLSPPNGGWKEELSPSSKSEAHRSESSESNIRLKNHSSAGGLATWSRPRVASRYIPSLAQLRGHLLETAENAAEHLRKEMERYKQRVQELEDDIRNERHQRENEVTAFQELLEHLQLQLMQKNVLYDSLERRLSLRTVEWEKLEKTLTWQRNNLKSDLEHKDEVVQDLRQSLVQSERSLQQQRSKCENLELTLRSQSEANACTAQINRELESEVVRLKAEVQLLRENLDSIEREDVGETVRKYETQLQQMKKENEMQQSVLRRRIEALQARTSQIERAERVLTNGDTSSFPSDHGASTSIGQGIESTESGQNADTRSIIQKTGSQPIRSPPPLLRISTVLRQSGSSGRSVVDDASFAEVMPDDESSTAYRKKTQGRVPAGTNVGRPGDSQLIDEENSPAHCILMFESLQCDCSDCNILFETFKENWKKLEDELHISEDTRAKYEAEFAGVAQENETLRTRYERVVNSLEEVRSEALSAKLENSIKDQRLERLSQEEMKSQSLKEEIYHLQAEVRDSKAETSTLVKKVAELTMQNEELEKALQDVCERNVRLSEHTSKVSTKKTALEVGVVTVSIVPPQNAKVQLGRGSSQRIVRNADDVIKVKGRGSADIWHTASGASSLPHDSDTRGKVRQGHTETGRILSRGHIDAMRHHLRSCVVDEKLRTLCIWLLGVYEQQIAKLEEFEKPPKITMGEDSPDSQANSHANRSQAAPFASSKGNNFRSDTQIGGCSKDARALDQDDHAGVTPYSVPLKPDGQFRAQVLLSEQDQNLGLGNIPSDWKSSSCGVSSPLPNAKRTNCITSKALQQNISRDGSGNGNLTTPQTEKSDSTTISGDSGPFPSENTTQNIVLFEEDSMILQPLAAAINGLSECGSLIDTGNDLQPSTKTEQQTLKSPLKVSGEEQQTDPQQSVDSVTSSPGGSLIENFTLFDDEETCTLLAAESFESDVLKGDLDCHAWTEAAAPF